MTGLFMDTGATFGGAGDCYRFRLWRQWDNALPYVCWVMLNPSTADASNNDPTIRKCMGFSERWGFGGIVVVNIFALRSTDPKALKPHAEPIGRPENDAAIHEAAWGAGRVIAAWGRNGTLRGRQNEVRVLLRGMSVECLGTNKDGTPLHPLYVPYEASPARWGASA